MQAIVVYLVGCLFSTRSDSRFLLHYKDEVQLSITQRCAYIFYIAYCFCNETFLKGHFHVSGRKASPPTENITNIWLIGCILAYSTVFMTTSINPTSIICKVSVNKKLKSVLQHRFMLNFIQVSKLTIVYRENIVLK